MEPPPRRFRAIALILSLTGLAVGLWFAVSRAEPVYRGKPISYWIEPWRHTNETPATVEAAFAEMDDRAVEWLIHELKWKPSGLTSWINRFTSKWDIELPDKPDRRERAAVALSELGTRGTPALPDLQKLVASAADTEDFLAAISARAALARIRNEPLEKLFREAESGAPWPEGLVARFALTFLPEHAESSIPFLTGQLALTNSVEIRYQAASALGEMASRTDDCVPQLIACLDSPEMVVQWLALKALARFGTNAANAIPRVSMLTNSVERLVFRSATNALPRIQHGPPKIPFSRFKGLESD